MAFPTIPTVAAGRVLTTVQADTSGTRTFPNLSSLTKNNGDLLIAIIAAYQSSVTNAAFSSWGAGFSEIHDSSTSTTMAIGIAYKFSTGSETGTFTVTQAATITGHATMILLSIPLANRVTAPEAGSRASGTTAAADPASFDPAGWGAEDTLWIAVGGSGETSTTGSYTGIASAPANYSDYVDTGISGDVVGGAEGAVAFRQLNASAEDVGTFSVDTSNARNAAVVIAVRPQNNITATPSTASLTITTFAPTVSAPRLVTPGKLSLVTATFAPSASVAQKVTPSTASLTLTTFAPTVSTTANVLVVPSTAALTISTFAPTVSTPRVVTPTTAATSLATFAPTVSTPRVVTVGVTSLVTNGLAPTVSTPILATPSTGSLALSTFAPAIGVSNNQRVIPGTRALTVTTFSPSVTIGGDQLVVPGTRALTITTYSPSVTTGFEDRVHAMFVMEKLGPQPVVSRPRPATLHLESFVPEVLVNDDALAVELLRTFLSM